MAQATKTKRRSAKARSPKPYFESSIRLVEGYGTNGAKPRPFNYELAIRQFHGWAYAAAMKNANAVAGVPLRLYVRKRSGKKNYITRPIPPRRKQYLLGNMEERPSKAVYTKAVAFAGDVEEVIEQHPVLTVLQNVNDFQNGHQLTVLRQLDKQFTGNSYLHPILNGLGVPTQAWRMPPQWVEVIPSRDSWIGGYMYGRGKDIERKFNADEVIQFTMPNIQDVFYGRGWAQAAWTALGLHDSKREMDTAIHDNRARPDWLLSVVGAAPDTLKKLEAAVKEKLRGADKSGRFLAVSGEVKATPLQWEVDDFGTPTRVIEEIAAVSGVPVAMLLSNDPNRANSETSRVGWYRDTIAAYCKDDEEKLNEQWVSRFEASDDYFLAYDPVCFENEEALTKRVIGNVAGGVWTPNEGRAELGYPSHEDGDELYPPSGTTGGAAASSGDLSPGQNDGQGKPKSQTATVAI